MKFEGNLDMKEIIIRHFLGLFLGIAGGFLGHYVSPVFYVLVAFSPIMILTAILGWCPIYSLMGINHLNHD
jgi:Protein of unknown function (DUF2892)